MSETQKEKIREKIKEQYKNGRQVWCKGLNLSDKRIKKLVKKRTITVRQKGTFALENNPRWKGGIAAYKNLALREYGNKCQNCGKIGNGHDIHVHHIDKNQKNNKIENLRVLCAKCHRKEHPQKATEHQKKRASETHKGKSKSTEQRKKMSEARKLWWKNKNR